MSEDLRSVQIESVADECARAVDVIRNPYSENADLREVAHLAAIYDDEYRRLRIVSGNFSKASRLAYQKMFMVALSQIAPPKSSFFPKVG